MELVHTYRLNYGTNTHKNLVLHTGGCLLWCTFFKKPKRKEKSASLSKPAQHTKHACAGKCLCSDWFFVCRKCKQRPRNAYSGQREGAVMKERRRQLILLASAIHERNASQVDWWNCTPKVSCAYIGNLNSYLTENSTSRLQRPVGYINP